LPICLYRHGKRNYSESRPSRKHPPFAGIIPSDTLTPAKKGTYPSRSGNLNLNRSLAVRNQAKKVIGNILEDVRLGQIINTIEAQKVVNGIVENLMEDTEALLCLSQLKNRDEYTVTHSLNVSILSVAFAKQLGLGVDDLQIIGLGGLLHDLGKMRIPLEILNKPGKLTDPEFDIMKNHVLLGEEILEESGDFPTRAMTIVLQHHERYNGKGYPFGLAEEAIHLFGRISAIVDVYDAITSDRVYHRAMTPHEAVKKIYEWRTDFDQSLVESFIQTIGIYPLGSLVEINESDVGMVVYNNPANLLRPSVMLLLDHSNQRYRPPRLIDLMDRLPGTDKPIWSISKILSPLMKEDYLTNLLPVAVH
jgi:putative nucleotidyltransferase with HDIG domain